MNTQPKKILPWRKRPENITVKTIFIDTDSIVDFSTPQVTAQPLTISKEALINAAAHALVGAPTDRLKHLQSSLPSIQSREVSVHDGNLIGSSWHHGDVYSTYWLGSPENIIQRCDLTDNEREKLLTNARRQSTQGNVVYFIAMNQVKQTKDIDPKTIGAHNLTYLGAIVCELKLYPDIQKAVRICNERTISIVYASADDEIMVSAVAHHAQLLVNNDLPIRYSSGVPTKDGALVYANLSERARAQLFKGFDTKSTLLSDKPLPEIVKALVTR